MVEISPVERVQRIEAPRFQLAYKKPARPLVMERLTEGWTARERWSVEYLRDVAGDVEVPLYDSVPSRGRKHQHAPAARMPLARYLDRLEAGENDLRMFFFNILAAVPRLTEDFHYPELGLKLFRKLPVLFMGGRGARVQMHFDIDLADLLLCHFGGRKRVLLFPPEQGGNLYRVPFSFSALFDVNIEQPDYQRFPALRQARGQVAELNHGDVLYVPPGYWHYVIYEELGFSMTLRAFPRQPGNFARMLNNLLVLRTVDGLGRRFVGEPWNRRNERRAVARTHRRLATGEAAAATPGREQG
ncbi:cupin-like domain-containing protein [Alkalilimnicola sp. S0819]|uniref:cupin-like domain-containing protein n=1 Tax=Alkalilimnicola sp. S0819 TaxID=2613922 RepID=UPI0012628F96|nr:cupin-like domain-containing protein [Alkalilimnicola sp. S0819]KAB7623927.1 cupin-like domain-containing protein [Alkalilimnicola sp. S0819]MPQ16524.1 cupin-like domain-containing protein [Alkalilimnicola sp. S0819]